MRAPSALSILAVGLALGALIGSTFMAFFDAVFEALWADPLHPGLSAALPTVAFGAFWAWLLRQHGWKCAWRASLPVAALNAVLSGMLLERGFLKGVFMGLVGVVYWVPALTATLVVFGLPLGRANRLARTGLAGQQRAEHLVGAVAAGVAAVGVAVTGASMTVTPLPTRFATDRLFLLGLGALGVVAGFAASALAHARACVRRRFVEDASRGKIPGYRVDDTDEARVLVRVTNEAGGYRVAEAHNALFALDRTGAPSRQRLD